MKYSLIGGVILVIILAVLFIATGGNKNSSENTDSTVPSVVEGVPSDPNAVQPSNKNFNL